MADAAAAFYNETVTGAGGWALLGSRVSFRGTGPGRCPGQALRLGFVPPASPGFPDGDRWEASAMTQAEAESYDPVLEEASRELEAAVHDAQVAFDCIALAELDRAHTSAVTARAAADAAVTALQAALLTAGTAAEP